MRIVLQRVKEAKVEIDQQVSGEIRKGLLIFLGIGNDDSEEDIEWLVRKLSNLRIFSDDEGKMNLDIKEVNGEVLLVSQFTLHAKTKKGNRPSFARAAHPDIAIPLYEEFRRQLEAELSKPVETGEFGAMMDVELINDGPVTIIIDSKNRE